MCIHRLGFLSTGNLIIRVPDTLMELCGSLVVVVVVMQTKQLIKVRGGVGGLGSHAIEINVDTYINIVIKCSYHIIGIFGVYSRIFGIFWVYSFNYSLLGFNPGAKSFHCFCHRSSLKQS